MFPGMGTGFGGGASMGMSGGLAGAGLMAGSNLLSMPFEKSQEAKRQQRYEPKRRRLAKVLEAFQMAQAQNASVKGMLSDAAFAWADSLG